MKNFKFLSVVFSHIIFSILSFPQNIQRLNDSYGEKIDQPFLFNQNQSGFDYDTDREKWDPDNSPKVLWVPGEIIIKYSTTSFKEILGKEILSEYDNFKKELVNLVKENISVCKPVFSTIVNRMVQKNISEKQAKEELFNKRNFKSNGFDIRGSFLQNDFSKTVLIRFDNPELDPLELCREISINNGLREAGYLIEYVEPNYLYYLDYSVNDPYYGLQWSHVITKAEQGWDIQRGNKNIKLGIIDTGIDYLHEDLVSNYQSDISYDFVDVDTSAYKESNLFPVNGEDYTDLDDDPKDFHGHGTHVSGIAAATANNGIGISGVAHNCTVIMLRAGFSILSGGYETGALESDDISNAIVHAVSNNIDILNMSFGSGSNSQTLYNAIKSASENGIILIAAAGNNSDDGFNYPAAYDNVISVSSVNSSDKRSYFSNFGNWVDIAAPGESILSTVPKTGGSLSSSSGYRYLNGTSMASPYVAGLAVLILSKNPSLTPQQVEYIIAKSSDLPKETANFIGKGRVNVFEALKLEAIKSLDIDAEILSPAENQFHASNIDIIGTAGGSEFILEYGYGIYPSSWTEINRGNSVQNGLLGTLNISGLASGQYTIRLTARDAANEKEVRITARIGDTGGLHAGFPLSTNFIDPTAFTISDLDGNGTKEIIVADYTNNLKSNLYVFDSEGQIQPGWPQVFPIFYLSDERMIAADINNDGKKEIIIYGTCWFEDIQAFKGIVIVYNYNGSILNGWPKRILEYSNSRNYIATSDIDLNGSLDIVLGSEGLLHAFNYDGTYLTGWPVQLPYPYYPRSPIVIANIDSDPQLEVITTVFHNLDPNNSPHYTYAYNYDGSVVSGFPYTQSYWGWALAGGDINNDGKVEIMTQHGPISNTGLNLPWNHTTMESYSQFTIGNVNDDPYLEIIYGNNNGYAYLSNYKGEVMPGWPIRVQEFSADGSHIIADIAGDDKPEIIIVWEANTAGSINQKTGLYAYNIDGTLVQGFPKFSGIFNMDKAAVDDIDNDGFVEIIGMDYGEKTVFVWDMDKTYKPENTEWPIYQNNTWLTGVYPYYGNNILTDFESFSINEDDTLKIHVSPNYINWNIYEVLPYADSSSITTFFDNGVLKVIPQPNWNGESRVSLSLSKEQLIDSTSFLLKVVSGNDQPVLLANLEDVSINEDDFAAVIIPDINNYFYDVDIDDHLTFSATAVGAGLDSIVIGKLDGLYPDYIRKSFFTIKRSMIKEFENKNLSGYSEMLNLNKKFIDRSIDSAKSIIGFSNVSDTSETLSLIVYPAENFNGEIKVAVKAVDDSLAEAADTLLLTVLPVNDKPEISVIMDHQINEDDSLSIILNSTDIDNDGLNYSALSSYENISFRIIKDTLSIFPAKDWNGDTKITVIVTDGVENDTTEFNLSVIPVNDKPSVFNLLFPEEKSIRIITDSTITDSINFSWEKADDVENDSVFYSFSIHDSVNSLLLTNIKDTLLSLSCSQFAGWLNNGNSECEWFVFANDLRDTTYVLNGPFSLTFTEKTVGISDDDILPKEFVLYQNYPNPFNPSTKIKYNIASSINDNGDGLVSLKIYDILGNEVSILVNEIKQPGYYEIEFDSGSLSSGVYFYRLQAGSFVQTKKFLLIK
jgi:thermitase